MQQTKGEKEETKRVGFGLLSSAAESNLEIESPPGSQFSEVRQQRFIGASNSQIRSTTNAEANPPPPKVRTDEERRLLALTPNPEHYPLNLLDLQIGLALSKADFIDFLDVFYDQIEETGLLAFQYPEGPVAQAVLSEVTESLLVHLDTVRPVGFPATPEWFMAEWLERLFFTWRGNELASQKKTDEKKYSNLRGLVTGRHIESTPSPFSGEIDLVPLPPRAARRDSSGLPALRDGQLVFPIDSVAARVQAATIDQCIVSLEVWKLGVRGGSSLYEIAASRILQQGTEPHIHQNYRLETFFDIYEAKINADKPDEKVEIRFAKFGCFTAGGDFMSIIDQDSFETALSRLFMTRGRDNVLQFWLRLEEEDEKIERVALEERLTFEHLAEEEENERMERLSTEIGAKGTAQKEDKGKGPAARSPTLAHIGTPLRSGSDQPPGSRGAVSGIESPSSSPTGRFSIGGDVQSQISNAASTNAQRKDVHSGVKENESEFERPTSANSSRSRKSAVKETIHKALKGRKRESDADREERWEKLFHVENRLAFTRGGHEEEIDIDTYKPNRDAAVEGEGEGEGEVPDLEEASNEEDEKESEIKEADRVVAKLQDLQNLPELTQLSDPNNPVEDFRWRECCRMFSIDPEKTALSEVVSIAGLKTKLYQYQAFGVYWQMLTSRRLGGGFVADSMGLGKTLSFLSFVVVERQLSCLWAEVEKSRGANDGKHLQVEDHKENDVCPENSKPGWIECPCASSSPTSGMPPKSGVRLACVPDALVRSWWKEWKTHVDTTEATLGLNIVVDYRGAFDLRTSSADLLASSANPRNKTRLESVKTSGKEVERPHGRQSGWLVLTTAKSFKEWIKRFEYKGLVQGKNDTWKPGIRHQIVFGIAMIDESHEEYFKQTGRGKVLADLPPGHRPFLWGYSGTPFSQTPRGLEGVLWAIEQHASFGFKGDSPWRSHSVLQQFEYRKLDRICKDFDLEFKKDRPDEASVDRILGNFKPFLQNFVIRRTAETLWFGHRLIKLKQHCHQDMTLTASLSQRAERQYELIANFEEEFDFEKEKTLAEIQEKWDKFPDKRRTEIRPVKLGFNSLCRLQWRLRILSSFPFLLKLARSKDKDSRLDLTSEEALGFIRPGEKIKDNPYFRYIRNIVEDSPKCLWLSFLIQLIDRQTDYKGDEQKLVIMTAFPQVVFILKMFLLKYFPNLNDRVGLILPRMKAKDKTDALEAFTDAHDETGKRKQKRNNKILIGTTRLIGTGLQLTRACHLVLMEPDYEFVKELQGYGRIHRIGQKNKYSFSYRLIDSASEIEAVILKRQQDRRELVGRALRDDELSKIEDSTIPDKDDEELSQV